MAVGTFFSYLFSLGPDCMVKLPKEAERKAKEEGKQTKQADKLIYGDDLSKQDWR